MGKSAKIDSSKRIILSVELTAKAKADLASAVETLRMSQKDVIEAILAWFVRQEPEVQSLIAENLPQRFVAEVQREFAQSLLEQNKGSRFDGDIKGKSGTPET